MSQSFVLPDSYTTYTKRFCWLVSPRRVSSKHLLCFVQGQGQKGEQKHATKDFVEFHNHSPLLRTFAPIATAHLYCARYSLVTSLAHHFQARACTESKTQQKIELMTFALNWCANIFVGCSVTPTSFSDSSYYTKKQKKSVRGKFQLFLIYYSNRVKMVHRYRCARLRRSIL